MKRRDLLYSPLVFLCCLVFSFSLLSDATAAANRGLAVPANQLPNELKRSDIKDYYAGSGAKQVGAIQTVVGHVVVARENLRNSYYAAPGDKLFEKDVIFTLKGSKCRFKLIGEDVVMMGENTRMGIKDFKTNQQRSTKSSALTMARGKAMFYALRLFKHRSNAMVVETPTAVSGVRGTKWGVEVVEVTGGRETASRPVELADTSDTGLRILAQANPPSLPLFQTTILCFSGTVFTGSTAPPPPGAPPPPVITLGQGQMTTVGSGQPPAAPVITPLSLANSFTAGTFAPPPGDSGAPPPSQPLLPGSTLLPTTGVVTNTLLTTTTTIDTSTLTQQQTQQLQQNVIPNRPGGFATGMITWENSWCYSWNTNQSYGWINNFDSTYFSNYSGPKMQVSGTYTYGVSGGQLQMTYLDVPTGPNTWVPITSGLPATISYTVIDRNPYAEWGYWKQTYAMTSSYMSDTVYYFNNKSYYIIGDGTGSNVLRAVSGIYSGSAYGTYWTAGGGADMTGQFSAGVDFSTGTISNFNMHVAGNGHTATFSGMSGKFDNTLDPGRFWINSALGGSWGLDGYGTKFAWVNGRMFGPSAETMGGAWSLFNDYSSIAASGIFAGTRTGTPITVPTIAMVPAQKQGYYTGIATYEFNSDTFRGETYMSTTLQNLGSSDARAVKLDGSGSEVPSYYISVDGTGAAPLVKDLVFSGSPASNLPQVMQTTVVGQNAYMEWGSWTQPIAMLFGSDPYYFNAQGWYIRGDATTDAQMAALKASGLNAGYYGPAYGTMLAGSINPTATTLTGTVTANINFSTPAVTMFNLNLNSGLVLVQNATGTFNGSTSQFVINKNSGTWTVNGTAASQKAANGAVYGSTGQAIGGTWAIGDSDSYKYASGIFQGMRSNTVK